VIVVGAGLSGIGAALRLRSSRPGSSLAVLEARSTLGGTWDLFRYPGVRSDSDMYTLGYRLRPWRHDRALADGSEILGYLRETARETGVGELIRYDHRVVGAQWSTATARWTVTVQRDDGSGELRLSCRFLFVCSGYYRYDAGHTPDLPGVERFAGPVVHPQAWPADLDHRGRRVVVLGSGATAVTLVPALAAEAEHVTMMQRSPGYVGVLARTDRWARRLQRRLPGRLAYGLLRWKYLLGAMVAFQLSRRRPERMKSLLRHVAASRLPADFDIDRHFTPSYDPWDQRLCFAADGDLFAALRSGRASVVTDRVETVHAGGLTLASGAELPADILVTATGLRLLLLGGMELTVDGRPVTLGELLAYRGMMAAGVPNAAFTLGYTNASWTLKSDLVAGYVCRLLDHLDRREYASVTPVPPAGAERWATSPLIDLTAGYVLRDVHLMPRQGPRSPWRLHQNYLRDLLTLRFGSLRRGVRFVPLGPVRSESQADAPV